MNQSIAFIGGGRITKIFLQAFSNKNLKFSSIKIFETNSDVHQKLKKIHPLIKVFENEIDLDGTDILFIALHPPVIMDVLNSIKEKVSGNLIVISLAPKISLARIASILNTKRLVRLIPNATSYINQGYNPITFYSGFPDVERPFLMDLLGSLGTTFPVPEEQLESYALISAMLPTYFWFQWKELGELGMKMGLNESQSKQAIRETLKSALNLYYDSELPAEEVMDLIPIKPLAEYEDTIRNCFTEKLLPLFEKIKP